MVRFRLPFIRASPEKFANKRRDRKNPITRWLATLPLGHSAGGPAHSRTIRGPGRLRRTRQRRGVRWPSTALEHVCASQEYDHGSFPVAVYSREPGEIANRDAIWKNPIIRWLAILPLGHSAGGPAHSKTLRGRGVLQVRESVGFPTRPCYVRGTLPRGRGE